MEEGLEKSQIEVETSGTVVFANYDTGDFYIIIHPRDEDDIKINQT